MGNVGAYTVRMDENGVLGNPFNRYRDICGSGLNLDGKDNGHSNGTTDVGMAMVCSRLLD